MKNGIFNKPTPTLSSFPRYISMVITPRLNRGKRKKKKEKDKTRHNRVSEVHKRRNRASRKSVALIENERCRTLNEEESQPIPFPRFFEQRSFHAC